MRKTEFERLWEKVLIGNDDECWRWLGSSDTKGYGRIWVQGRMKQATRRGFRMLRGEIPQGHLVCHTCDHPWCMRPPHWFTCTNAQNLQDAANKGRLKHLVKARIKAALVNRNRDYKRAAA